MRTLRSLAGALALVALVAPAARAGVAWSQATLDQYFRVQWDATPADGGVAVSGTVTNVGSGPAHRMQVAVERLDTAGAVVGSTTAWVVGDIPAGQRGYFTARVPAAASYRVRVLAFDWANCRN